MDGSRFLAAQGTWRRCSAEQGAFLVDGQDYFAALHQALGRAREQVLVLAWDIDSRVRLLRETEKSRNVDVSLGDRLDEVLEAAPGLRVYLLAWDYAALFWMERQWIPPFRLPWAHPPRLSFEYDDELPIGASHHQKVVVIDDAVAFCGGLDPTQARWDTTRHRRREPARHKADGSAYGPFHDLMTVVAGPPAAALGDLARERWWRATGERLAAPGMADWRRCWPESVKDTFAGIDVAVSRTAAAHAGFPAVHEVLHSYLAQIFAARRYLYFENQYLTSGDVVEALCERLEQPQGPDVVIVVPREASGWLEETTMGEGRDRSAERLRSADRFGRLRILCPVTGQDPAQFVNVHAKLLIADDCCVRIGSANLSNRSMYLDTECDLTFDAARDPMVARDLLARLVGEHTGAGSAAARRALDGCDRLIAAIDSLGSNERRLEPLPRRDTSAFLTPVLGVADPERPLEPEAFRRLFGDSDGAVPDRRRSLTRILLLLAALVVVALAWKTTPLGEWLDPVLLARWRAEVLALPWTRVIAVLAFPLGSVLVAPVTLLIAACAFVFGPYEGFVISLAGAGLAAAQNYGIGARFGRDLARRLAGPRVSRISRRLGKQCVLAMTALRLAPVAPFTIVNIVAGASHIGFRDFMVGTMLGMGPGTAVLAWLAGNTDSLLHSADLGRASAVLAGFGVLLALFVGLRAWVRSRDG